MIVDDSAVSRRFFRDALEGVDITIAEAADGIQALENIGPETRLVLSDVNMPRMNGLELLEELFSRPGKPPTVIFVTTGIDRTMIARATALGAAWLKKPVKPEALRKAALSALGRIEKCAS